MVSTRKSFVSCGLFVAVLGSCLLASPSQGQAATFFTEDFNGDVALDGSKFAQFNAGGGNVAPVFTGTTMNLQNSYANRQYFRTVDSDYSTVDFIAEVTMTTGISNGGNTNTNRSWFLMYNGAPNVGEPETNPSSGLQFGVQGRDTIDNGPTAINGGDPTGITRIRLTWTAATMQMLAELDFGYTGTFLPDASYNLNGADNGFTAANSYITFGGSGGGFTGLPADGQPGLIIDDFSIQGLAAESVPEPSTLVLAALGLAGLGLLAWRRRRIAL